MTPYEPAWLTEATFELGELITAIESDDDKARDDVIWQGEEQHE